MKYLAVFTSALFNRHLPYQCFVWLSFLPLPGDGDRFHNTVHTAGGVVLRFLIVNEELNR
jgi:hypothetical protein